MSVPMGGYPSGPAPMTGRIDFAWIGQAWALFMARAGVWIGAFLLYSLIGAVLWFLWAVGTGTLVTFQQLYVSILNHTAPRVSTQNPYYEFARTQGFTLLLTGANAVFFAGFYRMALRQVRGEAIGVGGLFSAFPQFLPLAMVAVFAPGVVMLLEALFLWFLHLAGMPGRQSVSLVGLFVAIPSIVLQGLLMFAPLLVLDQGANATDAIIGSLRLLKGQWLMAVLFYFIVAMIGGLGIMACGVGMLASYPLFLISIAVGYQNLTQPPLPAYPPYGAYPAPTPGVWPPPPTV
ncbi:MAG: hypothetical protein M3Y13_14005 [Armatimonadota bacterium]|nr:hypothetical protein [Armatimonadota bacterium]